jgi:GxxExxY protein
VPADNGFVAVELTDRIIGGFYHAYHGIGFGFSEPICANALAVALRKRGLRVQREVAVDVVFEGVDVGRYRLDMVVEDLVVVEIKATKDITDGDRRQLLSYLKASGLGVGLLLNFGPTPTVKRMALTKA